MLIAVRDHIKAIPREFLQSESEFIFIYNLFSNNRKNYFWCPLPTFQQRNQIPRRFANCPSRNRLGNDLIVVGDFNLSAFDWQNTHALNNSANNTLLLDILHGNFLTLLVNSPTREENILDLDLAFDPHIVDNLTVGEPFSDHNAITFSISCCPYERHKTGFIYESCFIISLGTMSS